jgi:hypothetical protein
MANMFGANPIQLELDSQIQYILQQHVRLQNISQAECQAIYGAFASRDVQSALNYIQQRCGNGPANSQVINEVANEYVQNTVAQLRQMAMQNNNRFVPANAFNGGVQSPQSFGFNSGMQSPNQQFVYGGPMAPAQQTPTWFVPLTPAPQAPQKSSATIPTISPAEGLAPMVMENAKFEEPIQEESNTDRSTSAPELLRHSVYRVNRSDQCVDVAELKMSSGYICDNDVIRDAKIIVNRNTTTHAGYVYRIRYPKLWLIRESPVKINAVLRKLITSVSQTSDSLVVIHNIIAVLQDSPAGISKIFETWILDKINYYMSQGCFHLDDSNLIIKLHDLKDLCKLLDKTIEFAEVRKLMEKEGDRYFDYIKQRISELCNMIKQTCICDVTRSSDVTDIIHGYGDEVIDGVSARDVLRSLVESSTVVPTTTNTTPVPTDTKINIAAFLSKYTVMRFPAVIWASNIVPVEQFANLGLNTATTFKNGTSITVLRKATNMLEWVLINQIDAAPLVISPNDMTNIRLNVVYNLNKHLVLSAIK